MRPLAACHHKLRSAQANAGEQNNLSTLSGHQSAASQASIASLKVAYQWSPPPCRASATRLLVLPSTQVGRLSMAPENRPTVATAYLPCSSTEGRRSELPRHWATDAKTLLQCSPEHPLWPPLQISSSVPPGRVPQPWTASPLLVFGQDPSTAHAR